jgi:hypothetical protein
MKIVLLVMGGVALLAAGVVVIGALLPKAHVATRSATYRASPERLFSLIAGAQDWRPDMIHSEGVSEGDGRKLLRETTRNGQTITYEVVESVPPRLLTRRIATENLPYGGSWSILLQPNKEGTIVRITENGEVYNPVFRFASRFVIEPNRTIDRYLRALGKANGQEVEIKD